MNGKPPLASFSWGNLLTIFVCLCTLAYGYGYLGSTIEDHGVQLSETVQKRELDNFRDEVLRGLADLKEEIRLLRGGNSD